MRGLSAGIVWVWLSACQPPLVSIAPTDQETGSAAAASLWVEVSGFAPLVGVARLAVFTSDEGFPAEHDKALVTRVLPVDAAGLGARIDGLRAGQGVCVAVIHDANDNRRLDTNLLGIPIEAFGVSNNPKPGFGPPKCSQAWVELKAGRQRITIELRRL